MIRNSDVRARLDRMPPLARRAVRALFGPALDLPDDSGGAAIVWGILKQLHLFAPVHAVAFAVLGGIALRQLRVSQACDPQIARLGRLTIFAVYEIAGVPVLTLAAAFAVRRRFRDPYTRHAARVSLILLTAMFVMMIWSAASAFLRQDARLRAFAGQVVRCAYDGTPPSATLGAR